MRDWQRRSNLAVDPISLGQLPRGIHLNGAGEYIVGLRETQSSRAVCHEGYTAANHNPLAENTVAANGHNTTFLN